MLPQRDGLRKVDFIDGVCLGLSKKILELKPLLEESLPMGYGTDYDFCFLAKQNGLKNYVVDGARVYHEGHKTFDLIGNFGNASQQGWEQAVRYFDENYGKGERERIRPDVSVIVPCYNQGKYLEEAISSIVLQTHKHIEIIIVDDGSTDATPEIIRGLLGKWSFIKTKRIIHGGPSSARNEGIDMSSAPRLLFLDADDILFPDAIEKLLSYQADVVYGKDELFGEQEGITNPPEFNLQLLKKENYIRVTSLVDRDAVIKVGKFTTIDAFEDWDLWLRMARKGCSFQKTDIMVFKYRRYGQQMRGNKSYEEILEQIKNNNKSLYNTRNESIAIIIATYNHPPEYLEQAVQSAIQQDYPNKEILIIDDGSDTNYGGKIAEKYNCKFLYIPHSGLPTARNTVLDATDADFFLPLDDDDELCKNIVSRGMEAFEDNVGVVYGSMIAFELNEDSGQIYHPRNPNDLEAWKSNTQIFQTSFIRRKAYEDAGKYWNKAWTAEDWDLYLRIFLKGWKFKKIPDVVYRHRVWSGGKWEGGEKHRFEEYKKMVLEHCGL